MDLTENTDIRTKDTRMFVALLCFVCLATVAALWPVLHAGAYCYDDDMYLVDNLLVRHPSLASAWQFLSEVTTPSTVNGYYQPLSMISLMLDSAAGGDAANLMPYHRTSLLLHLCNSVFIAILLYLLFRHPWAACATALLFALHPLAVEPIAWIGERKTLLAAFFSVASLVAYVRFTQRSTRAWYISALLLYILALMSKPTSTPLPLVMLLLDFWPLKRFSKRSLIEKLPFIAIGAISAIITVISQRNTAMMVTPGDYGPLRVLLVFGYDIAFYLEKMLVPVRLSSHYAFPLNMTLSNPTILTYLIASILLLSVLAISLRWTRAPLVGWLIFFVMILPTMQVLQFSYVIASDKYAYLPAIGMLIVIAWGLASLWSRAGRYAIVAILVIAAAEFCGSRNQLAYWKDSVMLYSRMLEITPNAISPRDNLAIALARRGDLEGAMHHLQISLKLAPDAPRSLEAMGTLLVNLGRPQEALDCYLKSIASNPNMHGSQYNAGVILIRLGRVDEALPYCRRAVELKPGWPLAHLQLGIALKRLGDQDAAIASLTQAAKLDPELRKARAELADIYVSRADWENAINQYREILEIAPDYDSLNNLASALVQAGRTRQAQDYYRQAIALEPSRTLAYCNLAIALAKEGHSDEALGLFRKVLELDPANSQARKYIDALRRDR